MKLFILLICFYPFNFFEILTKFLEKNNFRNLLDTKINFDKSTRNYNDDLKSIENCENSDYKYFLEYITGHNVTFDKNINNETAVSFYNIYYINIKYLLFRTYLLE